MKTWLIFMFILLVVSSALAEERLFVAGMEMKLGMSKDYVLGQLKGKYKLIEAGKDSWFIHTKEGEGPPYEVLGGVGFKKGQLSWISNDWGSFKGEAATQFAKELYSALSNIQAESQDVIRVNVSISFVQPGLRGSEINFVSGNRKVIVILVEGREEKGGNQVSIQETLSKR